MAAVRPAGPPPTIRQSKMGSVMAAKRTATGAVPLAQLRDNVYTRSIYGNRMKKTKTFKSGNSVAVRLPKSLGVEPGVEMTVREERGRYIVEPVEAEPRKIDLTGITGSAPHLRSLPRYDFEDMPRDWHLLEGKPQGGEG